MTLVLALRYGSNNEDVAVFSDRREKDPTPTNYENCKIKVEHRAIVTGSGSTDAIEDIICTASKCYITNGDFIENLRDAYSNWEKKFYDAGPTAYPYILAVDCDHHTVYALSLLGRRPITAPFFAIGENQSFATFLLSKFYANEPHPTLELIKDIAFFTFCFISPFDSTISNVDQIGQEGIDFVTTPDLKIQRLTGVRINGERIKGVLDKIVREAVYSPNLYKDSQITGEDDTK